MRLKLFKLLALIVLLQTLSSCGDNRWRRYHYREHYVHKHRYRPWHEHHHRAW